MPLRSLESYRQAAQRERTRRSTISTPAWRCRPTFHPAQRALATRANATVTNTWGKSRDWCIEPEDRRGGD